MQHKVVTLKELTEGNPTLCLSTLRVFGKCHQCPSYIKHPDKLRCNPVVSLDTVALIEHRKKLMSEVRKADEVLADRGCEK